MLFRHSPLAFNYYSGLKIAFIKLLYITYSGQIHVGGFMMRIFRSSSTSRHLKYTTIKIRHFLKN